MATGRTQRTKRQHYVPRCYLGRFSKDKKSVWVFDKVTKKTFLSNVMGIAQEHGFYDLPVSVLEKVVLPHDGDPQVAEKVFARVEGELARCIEQLVDESRRGD